MKSPGTRSPSRTVPKPVSRRGQEVRAACLVRVCQRRMESLFSTSKKGKTVEKVYRYALLIVLSKSSKTYEHEETNPTHRNDTPEGPNHEGDRSK